MAAPLLRAIRVSRPDAEITVLLLLAEPRRLRFQLNDGVWLRALDLDAALGARSLAGEGEVVVELADAFVPVGYQRLTRGMSRCSLAHRSTAAS